MDTNSARNQSLSAEASGEHSQSSLSPQRQAVNTHKPLTLRQDVDLYVDRGALALVGGARLFPCLRRRGWFALLGDRVLLPSFRHAQLLLLPASG